MDNAKLSSDPVFSVIIVNFNGGDYLQGAVDSLKKQTFQDFELFVVDNASTDGSMEKLDISGLSNVQLMPETENHGFAKGNNLAAAKAKGDWLVMLNPDAVADESWLEKIKDGIDRFPDTKMFASAQYSLDEPSLMDGAGDCYHVFGIPWRGGYGRPVEEMPDEGECFSPCGASAAFHRQTFLDAEGFDESFFCYCEDVDLGFRLRLMGHRCIFLPQAMIHHAGSALSNKVGDFAVYHGTRNRLWVFVKNMPFFAFWLMIIPHFGMTFLIYLRGMQTGRAKAVRKAWLASWSSLSLLMSKRKDVQTTKTKGSFDVLGQMGWNIFRLFLRKTDVKSIQR
ncbi:glycosyltransferase family 2 protein [Hirschia maritima]|uniref:glycosyltransferase family 2 protein n=1 Tax=Hirschia maritima TaxID=1121961 RepID=UPI00037169F1|nr:glycosyltransferase family 2 protein [Hirschia maritima]